MAKKKNKKCLYLIGHAFIYTACIALVPSILICLDVMAYSPYILWMFLLLSISHLVIDYLKRFVGKLKIKREFTYDQLTHIAFITLAWCLWGKNLSVSHILNETAHVFLIALGLLILMRPIGIFIERGDIWDFDKASDNSKEEAQAQKHENTSRLIGYLERIIIYILLLSGQYTAIAFVIATKTIARYPEINNEEKHLKASYYIIGTLLSVTSVFVVTILLGLAGIG